MELAASYDSAVLISVLVLVCAFAPGERLEYDVRYGPLNLGNLALTALAPDTVCGESCYHFRAELESNPALSFLFRARYELETWCRMKDMVTLRSYKRTDESRYQAEWTAEYDYDAGRVYYSDSADYPLADSARDLLTLWYYFRTLPLVLGDTYRVDSHTDRRNYEVEVVGARQTKLQTRAGEFDCLEVVPSAGGPLGNIYLSEEPDRVPVVIRTKVGGMLVSAFLRSIEFLEEE